MRAKVREQRPLVEEGVDEVRIAVESVAEARVDDLEDHPNHLLQNAEVLNLRGRRPRMLLHTISSRTLRSLT